MYAYAPSINNQIRLLYLFLYSFRSHRFYIDVRDGVYIYASDALVKRSKEDEPSSARKLFLNNAERGRRSFSQQMSVALDSLEVLTDYERNHEFWMPESSF